MYIKAIKNTSCLELLGSGNYKHVVHQQEYLIGHLQALQSKTFFVTQCCPGYARRLSSLVSTPKMQVVGTFPHSLRDALDTSNPQL